MNKAKIYIYIIIVLTHTKLAGQIKINSIILDSETKTPIELVTINDEKDYAITNKDGRFNFFTEQDSITIRIIGYETINDVTSNFISKDTILLKPKPFILEEVTISSENFFNKMAKKVLTDYAILPHKERFFLRALLKRNNEIQKLIDINGFLERKTLYDTDKVPMPKRNYKVQISGLRKAEISSNEYDFEMYDLKGFLNFIASNKMPPSEFDFEYKTNKDFTYTKVIANPKSENNKTKGYYIVDRKSYNFDEFYANYSNPEAYYIEKKNFKYRLTDYTLTATFQKNSLNGKKQLKQAKVEQKIEVATNHSTDTLNMSYHFIAFPIPNSQEIKNNTKLTKNIFKISGKYNPQNWNKQETLLITEEIQNFIKKANYKFGF